MLGFNLILQLVNVILQVGFIKRFTYQRNDPIVIIAFGYIIKGSVFNSQHPVADGTKGR